MTAWQATAKRIKAWKADRENDLQKRLQLVRRYLDPFTQPRDGIERKLQKERPEWVARLPQARAEVAREQEAKKQAQREARQAQQKRQTGSWPRPLGQIQRHLVQSSAGRFPCFTRSSLFGDLSI